MIQTSIDRIDHRTGREVAIPTEALSVVERANVVLREQLASLEHLPLHASWCRFEHDPQSGWVVALHIFTDEYSYGQQVRVSDLRDPVMAKVFVREVLWQFAQTYSDKVGAQIRQIRADLKQLLAVGGE